MSFQNPGPEDSAGAFDCREIIRGIFLRRGAPEESIEILLASWAPSTLKQYSPSLKQWFKFCQDNPQFSARNPTKKGLLTFLTRKFREGASYGTLNSDRSAISLLSTSKLSEDEDISRFFRAIYKIKPPRPRYTQTWDTDIVLSYLRKIAPAGENALKVLSKKLVTLLALASAQRVQTLAALEIQNVKFNEIGVQLIVEKILKTSSINRPQPSMNFPFYSADPTLCVASCLKDYLHLSEPFRNGTKELFISFTKPHKAVTAQSLSRWIKEILKESGIDVSVFSSHSTRHASTSRAEAQGVNLDVIYKTAGWTSSSKTFANFYKRPILREEGNEFYSAILSNF